MYWAAGPSGSTSLQGKPSCWRVQPTYWTSEAFRAYDQWSARAGMRIPVQDVCICPFQSCSARYVLFNGSAAWSCHFILPYLLTSLILAVKHFSCLTRSTCCDDVIPTQYCVAYQRISDTEVRYFRPSLRPHTRVWRDASICLSVASARDEVEATKSRRICAIWWSPYQLWRQSVTRPAHNASPVYAHYKYACLYEHSETRSE